MRVWQPERELVERRDRLQQGGVTPVAAFGSMYFAITSMTDADHRKQFFAPVIDDVERTLVVRAVYLAVRDTSRTSAPTTPSG